MNITEEMLEQLKEKYEDLNKEYDQINYLEELYRVAIGLTKHTVSVVDIPAHSVHQIYYETDFEGIDSEMKDAPESIIATGTIHEDSVEAYRQMFKDIYAGQEKGNALVRVRDKSGKWSWLCVYYQVLFDQDKKPLRAVCFSENVSQKREAEMIFEQFIRIIKKKSEFFWQINLTKDEVTYADLGDLDQEEMKSIKSYSELNKMAVQSTLPEYQEGIHAKFDRFKLLQLFYDGQREVTMQYEFLWPGTDRAIWMESHMYLLMNTDSNICGMLSVSDIDEAKRKETERYNLAQYDPLCRVLKRDVFEKGLKEKMEKHESLTLFMIDVDKFKDVNDTYGHQFGDTVLKSISETIRSNFRKNDLVGRYGGDEFCVLMCGNNDIHILNSSASALLDHIRNLSFENDYQASISVGLAQWNGQDSVEDLFKKADEALYKSKETRGTFSVS